jgi:hypothetical protein
MVSKLERFPNELTSGDSGRPDGGRGLKRWFAEALTALYAGSCFGHITGIAGLILLLGKDLMSRPRSSVPA